MFHQRDYRKKPLSDYIAERQKKCEMTIQKVTKTHLKPYSFNRESFNDLWAAAKLPYMQYKALESLHYQLMKTKSDVQLCLSKYRTWLKETTEDDLALTNEDLFVSYQGLIPLLGAYYGDKTLDSVEELIKKMPLLDDISDFIIINMP